MVNRSHHKRKHTPDKANKTSAEGSLRIIGGEWRSRRLRFPAQEGLRPTTDRVRETLFNWIQYDVPGARVLDLFAGSGALGLEALSRGAKEVIFIDTSRNAINALQQNLQQLNCHRAQVLCADSIQWLQGQDNNANHFDLIFIDPPFRQSLVQSCLDFARPLLSPGGRVYLETEQELTGLVIPPNWQQQKSKTAGQVHYQLFRSDQHTGP